MLTIVIITGTTIEIMENVGLFGSAGGLRISRLSSFKTGVILGER
jgi:hypothetical protein